MNLSNNKENSNIKTIKNKIFSILYNIQQSQTNSVVVDLLILITEILTLHYLYINPHYPWIKQSPILQEYFKNIFPNLLFIYQQYPYYQNMELVISTVPICLLVYFISFIMLIILGFRSNGIRESIISTVICLLLELTPTFIFRMGFEIYTLGLMLKIDNQKAVLIFFVVVSLFGLILAIIVLTFKSKLAVKFMDFGAVFLFSFGVLWQIILVYLGIKFVISFWRDRTIGRNVKLGFQIGLYISLILLMFIKHSSINFILLGSCIGLVTLTPIFDIYQQLLKKDISLISNNNQQQGIAVSNKFTLNDLSFIKKINRHQMKCQNLYCMCHNFLKQFNDAIQLRKWAKRFDKFQYENKKDFESSITYALICLKEEQVNIKGLLNITRKQISGLKEQYLRHKLIRKYNAYIETNQIKLHISHLGKSNQFDPKIQILEFENKIVQVISKIKRFWSSLLEDKNNSLQLVQQVAHQIAEITTFYKQFQEYSEENLEVQYLYKVFKLVVLHQQNSSEQILEQTQRNYLIMSINQTITNISYNVTSLFETPFQRIIGSQYSAYMSKDYCYDHSTWVNDYLEGYKPVYQTQFMKMIFIEDVKIKVVRMQHILVPQFQDGMSVMTCCQQIDKITMNESDEKVRKNFFHILVTKIGLNIVAYEEAMLTSLDIIPNVDLSHKIMRSTLADIFSNITEECFKKTKQNNQKALTKPSFDFFDLNFVKGEQEEDQQSPLQQLDQNTVYQFTQIPLRKTEELGYILLKFQNNCYSKINDKLLGFSNKKTIIKTQKKLLKKFVQSNVQPQKDDSVADQASTQDKIIKYKILFGISFIKILILMITLFVLVEKWDQNHSKTIQQIRKESIFLQASIETTLYYSNSVIGKDNIHLMETLWFKNQNYTNVITSFQQIQSQVFDDLSKNKAISQRQHSLQNSIDKILVGYSSEISSNLQNFYTIWGISMLVIIIVLLASCFLLIQNQKKVYKIINKFLFFKLRDIRTNIENIKTIQKKLHLQNYNNQNKMIKFGNMKCETQEKFTHTIGKAVDLEISTHHLLIKKKSKKVMFTVTEMQEAICTKNQKQNYAEDQFIDESMMKHSNQSVKCMNLSKFIPSLVAFCLINSLSLSILFHYTKFMPLKMQCFILENKLSFQSIILLQKTKQIYLNISSSSSSQSLNQLFFENHQLINNLPNDFKSFIQHQNQYTSSNLCEFNFSVTLKNMCSQYEYIFENGHAPALQYITEYMRKIRMGQISVSQMRDSNQFLISIQILRQFYIQRNKQYKESFTEFELKNQSISILLKVLYGIIFLAYISLQYRSVNQTLQRTQQAENLFKIVPNFMQTKQIDIKKSQKMPLKNKKIKSNFSSNMQANTTERKVKFEAVQTPNKLLQN